MRGRVLGLVLLALSFALLLVPEFRWALELALRDPVIHTVDLTEVESTYAPLREAAIPAAALTAFAEKAKSTHDAQGLAFVAVTAEPSDESVQAADEAVKLDPKLAWIGYYMVPIPNDNADTNRWLEHLTQFDPENGAVYWLQANAIRANDPTFPPPKTTAGKPDPSELASHKEWLAAMEQAFAAPHFHEYEPQRMALMREGMQRMGRATPWRMAVLNSSRRTGNLVPLRLYANYKVFYLAANAERARHYDEALKQMRETSAFGKRMQAESSSILGRLIGEAVDMIGAQGEAELMRTQGKIEEAALAEGVKPRYDAENRSFHDELEVERTTSYRDLVRIHVLGYAFAGLALVAVLFTVFELLGPDEGRLAGFLRGTALLASLLLLLAGGALLLVYHPYGQRFRAYLNGQPTQSEGFADQVAPLWIEHADIK